MPDSSVSWGASPWTFIVPAILILGFGAVILSVGLEQVAMCSQVQTCSSSTIQTNIVESRFGLAFVFWGVGILLFSLVGVFIRFNVRTKVEAVELADLSDLPLGALEFRVHAVERLIDARNVEAEGLANRAAVILGFLSLVISVTFTGAFLSHSIQAQWGVYSISIFLFATGSLLFVVVQYPQSYVDTLRAIKTKTNTSEDVRLKIAQASASELKARTRGVGVLGMQLSLGTGLWLVGLLVLAIAWWLG